VPDTTTTTTHTTTTTGTGGGGTYPDSGKRYVTDPTTGKAVLLAGAYTGVEFQDYAFGDDTHVNWDGYLNFLTQNNLNFIRLWREETSGTPGTPSNRRSTPQPYAGSYPNFNANQWNQGYFDRMAGDVAAANAKGIWTGIMLFNAWSLSGGNGGRKWQGKVLETWDGHPLNSARNGGTFDGDTNNDGNGFELEGATSGALWDKQVAYVDKVIDTVNQYDRVIYEIANEGTGSASSEPQSGPWQEAMKNHIKQYEASKAKHHPVQISQGFGMSDSSLYSADVSSPTATIGTVGGTAGANNAIVLDTDHGNADGFANPNTSVISWAWKNFTRGYNMNIEGDNEGSYASSYYLNNYSLVIGALKTIRALSERVTLKDLSPQNSECSDGGFCLGSANEVIAYAGSSGSIDIDMSKRTGTWSVEHINTLNGNSFAGNDINAGASVNITRPGGVSDWALYLKKK
jgi:hypothetical protein